MPDPSAAALADEPATLVVGGGGLLGSSLVRVAVSRGAHVEVARVDWHHDPMAGLGVAVDRLAARVGGDLSRWRVAWCAGAGVTSSEAEAVGREVSVFRDFLAAVRSRVGAELAPGVGSVFLASSAGGVYAGAKSPPFTEETEPRPVSAYGEGKLALEETLRAFGETSGVRGVVGRITNLYGPGQNLSKPQGLVSHLCRGHVTGRPVGVYVPLDTLRDYLYVDDCAELVLDTMGRAEVALAPGEVVVKILASHRSVSVGALLKECQRVFHRPLRVLLAASPLASAQAIDLRVRSDRWPDLDRRVQQTLAAGIAATVRDVEARVLRQGSGAARF